MQGTVAKKQSSFRDKWEKISGSDIFSAIVPLLILIVLVTIINPCFLSGGNIISMLNLIPFVAICCLGNALVIMTGSADISVGKTSGLAAIIFGWTIKVLGVPVWLAVILGILTGGLVGFLNSFLIFNFNLPEFIVTLGMSYVVGACRFFLSKGYPFTGFGDGVKAFGSATVPGLGVNIPFVVCVVLYVIIGLILAKTTFGRHIKAVGDNPQVAALSGINVVKVKKFAYIVCGLIVAIAGILMVIRLDYANPYTGNGWEFKCIAACAIGGVSLNGGRGNGFCIAIGVASMMVLDNAIIMMGIDTNLQTTAIGAFLMIAASLDMIKQRKKIRAEALNTVEDTAAVAE